MIILTSCAKIKGVFEIKERSVLAESYLEKVCKFGQESLVCRFLVLGTQGLSCAKKTSSFRDTIEQKKGEMRARGNNCSGPPDFIVGDLDSKESN